VTSAQLAISGTGDSSAANFFFSTRFGRCERKRSGMMDVTSHIIASSDSVVTDSAVISRVPETTSSQK
jgi:hypothetical protein